MPDFYLAQCNVARLVAPLDSPQIAPFIAELARINALAEDAPGFVWRLRTPAGDATTIRFFDDEMTIVNMSVWESVDALFTFTYATDHLDVFRKRADWFERHTTPAFALWWINANDPMPTAQDIPTRMEHLGTHGPTPFAFTFKQRFPAAPPDSSVAD